jgi:SAM-dependent methyltransferase
LKIHPNDFVLEIGSGHHPKTRSDILCDKFIDNDTERGFSIVMDRPLVEADGQYLPFADRSFDYVICSHVLEHVEDPGLLFSELMRVASRGYIESPSEICERLYGWPFHKWLINLVEGRLILQKKVTRDQFGLLFHSLLLRDKYFARFHLTHPNLLFVRYEWEEKIDFEIVPSEAPLWISAHVRLSRGYSQRRQECPDNKNGCK